jgi:hypothetical protein
MICAMPVCSFPLFRPEFCAALIEEAHRFYDLVVVRNRTNSRSPLRPLSLDRLRPVSWSASKLGGCGRMTRCARRGTGPWTPS